MAAIITTVTYEGGLELLGPQSYARSVLQTHGLVPEGAKVALTMTYDRGSEGGPERVSYAADGRPFLILWRDRTAFTEIDPVSKQVTFRPPAEGGAYAALGAALPPAVTSLFLRSPKGQEVLMGDRCGKGEDCQDLVVTFHLAGGQQYVRSTDRGKTLTSTILDGVPQAVWRLGPDRSGFPESFSYQESRPATNDLHGPSTVVAKAYWRLAGVSTRAGVLQRGSDLKKGALAIVKKGRVGYAAPYDPDRQDIWAYYDTQERLHAQIVSKVEQPIWGRLGFGIVLLAIAIVGCVALFRHFRRRARPVTEGEA